MVKYLFKIFLISLVAILLNGEFLAHGLLLFKQLSLFLFYFLFILILDQYKNIFKTTYRSVFLLASSAGLFFEGFFAGSLYKNPQFLGINWLTTIAQMFAYGFFVGLLPLFLKEKLFNKNIIKESKGIFFTAISAMVILLLVWFINLKPSFNPSFVFIVPFIFLFVLLSFKNREENKDIKERLIYIILIIYTALEVIVGLNWPELGSLYYGLSMLFFGLVLLFLWKDRFFTLKHN